MGVRHFSQVISDVTRGNCLNLHQGRFRFDIRKNLFTEGAVRHLVQAAQGSDGIAVPGSIQKTCGCGV